MDCDRRQHRRHPTLLMGTVRLDPATRTDIVCTNIGPGGAFFACSQEVDAGRHVDIVLRLDGPESPAIASQARVVRQVGRGALQQPGFAVTWLRARCEAGVEPLQRWLSAVLHHDATDAVRRTPMGAGEFDFLAAASPHERTETLDEGDAEAPLAPASQPVRATTTSRPSILRRLRPLPPVTTSAPGDLPLAPPDGPRGGTRLLASGGAPKPMIVETDAPLVIPPALLDRYDDLVLLGRGGNGIVFRAIDRRLERLIVLKFMASSAMPTDVARRYFLREVKLAARLNHRNIVHIYDSDEIDGVLYYAMEYVDGAPLTAHVADGRPMRDRTLLASVVGQLCDALEHAHGHGILHRDVKPDNVLVGRDGVVKLSDFGLARQERGFGHRSLLVGTPHYMAPEQLDGSKVDHRADIYALGVVVYRLLTGRTPFDDDHVFAAHLLEAPPDPRQFCADLSPALVAAVLRMLAKRPADRPQDARSVKAEMEAALRPVDVARATAPAP